MSYDREVSKDALVQEIIILNERHRAFWKNARGWAPVDAAELLSKSRLDWQVSLSETLSKWVNDNSATLSGGERILAWANLGALVEGSMKLFLCVYFMDFKRDLSKANHEPHYFSKNGKLKSPDILKFEDLRQFIVKREIFGNKDSLYPQFISRVQGYRNVIHAFRDRDLGSYEELIVATNTYLQFLQRIETQLPYPDSA